VWTGFSERTPSSVIRNGVMRPRPKRFSLTATTAFCTLALRYTLMFCTFTTVV